MQALVIESEKAHGERLQQTLQHHGFEVALCSTTTDAREITAPANIDLVFLALDASPEDSIGFLQEFPLPEQAEIILMNSEEDTDRVNAGISAGASYYFTRPFDQGFIDELAGDIVSEIKARENRESNGESTSHIDQFGLLRGGSRIMRSLYRRMRKVAHQDTAVLVVGESGVGKDLVAQSIHMLGSRADQPFVAMNCAAVPEELFESELFGHEKGSFSGAVDRHKGFFEQAARGTLFLDEITEMPIDLQAKLLRVLDGSQFRRLGGYEDLPSSARIIASTNRDPATAIDDGRLREDLYFRLAGVVLSVPPLRDRGGDALGLAEFFLADLNTAHNTESYLADDARVFIAEYDWPGNVRELKSAIGRAHVLCDGAIDASCLHEPEDISSGHASSLSEEMTIEEAERQLIMSALERFDTRKEAAASLGISLKTLYNKLKSYDLDDSPG